MPAHAAAGAIRNNAASCDQRASDADTARAVLTRDRYADIEVHNWAFGGRPS